MKQIYLNMLISNDSPASIGMVTQSNETFYGEFSDFNGNLPEGAFWKFDEPGPCESEHWMWSLKNDVEMRGDKKEISKNIIDWFHAIVGNVALSWVDYSESMGGPGYRNIKPIIDKPCIAVITMTEDEWESFIKIFDSFPKCLFKFPIYLNDVTKEIINDISDIESFRYQFHNNTSKFDPLDNCRVLDSYMRTAVRVKESQK